MDEIVRFNLDVVDSTQSIAEKSISELKPGVWHLWTAKRQTAGRGQRGRAWYSPRGNVYATYAFTSAKTKNIQCLPLVAAYSIIEVMQQLQVKGIKLRWINDLAVRGKKMGGVLVNVHALDSAKIAVVIGVGLNINCKNLSSISCASTSLATETGKRHNIDKIINLLSRALKPNIESALELGFGPFHYRINELLEKFDGRAIAIDTGSKVIKGKILEIDQMGGLVLSGMPEEGIIRGTILKDSIEPQ